MPATLPLCILPSGQLGYAATLADYPSYVFYSDGRILNAKRSRFLKHDGSIDRNGYRTVTLRGLDKRKLTLRVHKLIALAFHGVPQAGQQADHINRNKLDNAASNLRYVSRLENAQNRSPNKAGSSPYQGVSLNKKTGKYRAHIMAAGVARYLGQFETEEAAAAAYATAKARYHLVQTSAGLADADVARALTALAGKRVETSATRSIAQTVPL